MARIVKAPYERRREFIATAQQLFYTKGYERTSVNDIINEVGVSKGAFYHYFDSKEVLLEQVVDELVEQSTVLVQAIIAEKRLDAIAKFNHMMQMLNNWKIEQKDELLAISRILHMDENLRLFHQLRAKGAKMFAPALGQIVAQGMAEGVFDTELPQEAAEFAFAVIRTMGDACIDILFNQETVEDPVLLMLRKISAAQTAVERILGAPQGSLVFIDTETVAAWFE